MKPLIIEIKRDAFYPTSTEVRELVEKAYKRELKKEITRLVKADAIKRANRIYQNFGKGGK